MLNTPLLLNNDILKHHLDIIKYDIEEIYEPEHKIRAYIREILYHLLYGSFNAVLHDIYLVDLGDNPIYKKYRDYYKDLLLKSNKEHSLIIQGKIANITDTDLKTIDLYSNKYKELVIDILCNLPELLLYDETKRLVLLHYLDNLFDVIGGKESLAKPSIFKHVLEIDEAWGSKLKHFIARLIKTRAIYDLKKSGEIKDLNLNTSFLKNFVENDCIKMIDKSMSETEYLFTYNLLTKRLSLLNHAISIELHRSYIENLNDYLDVFNNLEKDLGSEPKITDFGKYFTRNLTSKELLDDLSDNIAKVLYEDLLQRSLLTHDIFFERLREYYYLNTDNFELKTRELIKKKILLEDDFLKIRVMEILFSRYLNKEFSEALEKFNIKVYPFSSAIYR